MARSIPKPWAIPAAEVWLYASVTAWAVYALYSQGVRLSNEYAAHFGSMDLSPGWIAGRLVDLSDEQWRSFRGSLPLLSAAFAAFCVLSRAARSAGGAAQLAFYIAFAAVFQFVLHGVYALHVAALLFANYLLATRLAGRPAAMPVIWAFHVGTFLAVRIFEGFPVASLPGTLGASLGGLPGGMLRWHIHYNLLVLRMISFAVDCHWAATKRPPRSRLPPGTAPHEDMALRDRAELPQPAGGYNLAAYVAYALYAPLHIAGPTMTFNTFASQLRARSSRTSARQVLIYGLRLLASLFVLELILHTVYSNAMAKHARWRQLGELRAASSSAAGGLSPLETSSIGYWVLVFMWLKFTVIWRFFRFWALADGIEAPENMTRCVCNNYDIEGFWKNWHASYNLWLVRYLYIPLGGAKTRLWNVWVIFTFVALWHDLEWRLLAWAWMFALFMAPEMAAKWAGRQPWLIADKSGAPFRYLCAAAAAVNILVLMSANLVGFVVGLDGLQQLLSQLFASPAFAAAMLGSFFAAAQCMFSIRAREARLAAAGANGADGHRD